MYWLEFAGEDDAFAALEAASAAADVEICAPGVATATSIVPDRIRTLALTRAAGELLGRTDATVESACALLAAAPLDREGTVAVRARDVRASAGIDTQRVERELGSILVDRGFDVDLDDPDHVLRALFVAGAPARDAATDPDDPLDPVATGAITLSSEADAADCCLLGWRTVESQRTFGERAPTDRPFFQPGSMDPLVARALVNVAGAGPGRLFVDPMCGTGGLLVEAGLVGARPIGGDAQSKMVRGARENLRQYLEDRPWELVRADATRLPFPDDVADVAAVDVPYERQSAVAADSLTDLVSGALAELHRVSDRAVVVADRSWVATARSAGWSVDTVLRRRVHRSLVRYVHVLDN